MKKKIDHDFGSVLNGGFWVKFGEKSTKKLEQKLAKNVGSICLRDAKNFGEKIT